MELQDVTEPGWQKIVRMEEPALGMVGFIAVHNIALGPGCGGCRVFPYDNETEAKEDAKRLSRGMSYKNALGDIPFGGGKAVIIADPHTEKTPQMFTAFGHALNALEGLYYTAEDSGVTENDLLITRRTSPYVTGIADGDAGGGNPSPFTARGVFSGMRAALQAKMGTDSFLGKRVCIVGVGAVGMALAQLLHDAGAELIVADINERALAQAKAEFGAEIVSSQNAPGVEADIFSPCAMGGAVNAQTISEIRAPIIAGAANNQLQTPDMDEALVQRGILYAPDYVINAAGVISVGLEAIGQWSSDEMTRRIEAIGDRLATIFSVAEESGRPPGMVADSMALAIMDAASGSQPLDTAHANSDL